MSEDKRWLRERAARKQAEQLLEDKTRELFLANQTLEQQYQQVDLKRQSLDLFYRLLDLSNQDFDSSSALEFFLQAVMDVWSYHHAECYWIEATWQLKAHGRAITAEGAEAEPCDVAVLQELAKTQHSNQNHHWRADSESPPQHICDHIIIERSAQPYVLLRLVGDAGILDKALSNVFLAGQQLSSLLEKRAQRKELMQKNQQLTQAYDELKQTQAQLVQSSKMASIGQLAAGVAHEINNPLAFISSNMHTLKKYIPQLLTVLTEMKTLQQSAMAQEALQEQCNQISALMKKCNLDFIEEDIIDLIDDAHDGMTRVKNIVANLKSFARIDQDEAQEVDLNECIQSSLKIAQNHLKEKCTIHTDLTELTPYHCYPGQLNQVFLNMMINAGQAIETKGDLWIKTTVTDQHIEISFQDNGCGIESKHLEKLFDPFFTTKPVGEGTGLGLSVSYGIVQKHDGEIVVDSVVGEGTTFTIRLPRQVST